MEPIGPLVLGTVVSYSVTKLLNGILEAIRFIKHRKKAFKALESLLRRLMPLLVRTEILAKRIDVMKSWQEDLENKLQEAEKVVKMHEELSAHFSKLVVKGIGVMRDVVRVTADIKESESQASSMILAAFPLMLDIGNENAAALRDWCGGADEYLKKIGEEFRQVQTIVARKELADRTEESLSTPTSNFGSAVNTITVDRAFVQIKTQADAVADISNRPSNETAEPTQQVLSSVMIQEEMKTSAKIVFGGNENLMQLKKLLASVEPGISKWVGVWSMGGSGKTFTVQRAYSDPEISRHFTGGTFWLSVGRERSAVDLLNQLYAAAVGRPGQLTEANATEAVRRVFLKMEKVLLVLDDVWSAEVRDRLDVVAESSGGVILVTTRNAEILDQVFARKHSIKLLNEDHSWQLFSWHAFRGADRAPAIFKDLPKQVAAECKGLPLALKVIGGSMAGKHERVMWEIALKKLRNADTISPEHEKQLFGRLQLSVDDLESVGHEHLVDCFYYFAAFPEDSDVKFNEDLLGLWDADGLLDSDSGLFPEEEAYELVGWLIARSLIELQARHPSFGSNMLEKEFMTFKIHDILRDLARNNLQRGREAHQRLCLYRPGFDLKKFPKTWTPGPDSEAPIGSTNPALVARRLSLMHNNLEELPVRLFAPNLRVLLLGHNKYLQSLPREFFGDLTRLRVLDLRNTAIQEVPSQAFTSLKHLVLLNLSGCYNLCNIPRSVKDLHNLKELRVDYCKKLKSLPSDVLSLRTLETLVTIGSPVWNNKRSRLSPASFGTPWLANLLRWPFSFLWPLFRWNLPLRGFPAWCHSWRGPAYFEDMKLLTNLVRLDVTISLMPPFHFSLDSLKSLRHLHVNFFELEVFPSVDELVSLETLKIMSVKMKVLPLGLVTLSGLKTLDVGGSTSLSSLPALDELPRLEYLNLEFCPQLKLPDSFGRPGAFPSLLELTMNFCYNIGAEDFPSLQPGAMPEILLLNLAGWMKLRTLPDSLRVLQSLRVLILSACENLETLEPTFGPQCFLSLEELDLSDTKALQLPSSLPPLPKLRKLDVRRCRSREAFAEHFQSLEHVELVI